MKTFRLLAPGVLGPANRGFALVITLSLMILLTVIAVGLLTLSSISLRVSAQNSAMATAQSNARMALMLAIGELQASAGLDQRITAPAGVLGTAISQQRITGVWKSKKLGPASTATDFRADRRVRLRQHRGQNDPQAA